MLPWRPTDDHHNRSGSCGLFCLDSLERRPLGWAHIVGSGGTTRSLIRTLRWRGRVRPRCSGAV